MDDATRKQIQTLIDTHPIVIFMKGSKTFPKCGFSATVVEVMKRVGAEYRDVNILEEPVLRESMKEFSSWPTFPQIYLGGKFLGGADILRDMYTAGELEPLVREALAARS
jgi:monothiol glutaredoxin